MPRMKSMPNSYLWMILLEMSVAVTFSGCEQKTKQNVSNAIIVDIPLVIDAHYSPADPYRHASSTLVPGVCFA